MMILYPTLKERLQEVERTILQEVLLRHNGSCVNAAKELGVSRYTMYRRARYYGLMTSSGLHIYIRKPPHN